MVRNVVQVTILVNLQHVHSLITENDVGRTLWLLMELLILVGGGSYFEARIRFAAHYKITNVHGLAIPIHGTHTGDHMHRIVRQFLCGVTGGMWSAKLLSVGTDGARKMTEMVLGEVTRIESELLPGFF